MVQYLSNGQSGFQQFMARKGSDQKSGPGSTIIWVAIAALAGWLMYSWLAPKPAAQSQQPKAEIAVQAEDISQVPLQQMQNPKLGIRVQGLRISGLQLHDYIESQKEGGNIMLLADNNEFTEIGLLANGTMAPTANTVWKSNHADDAAPVTMIWKNPDGVEFTRTITIENYTVNVTDTIKNTTSRDFSVTPYARIVRNAGAGAGMATVASGGVAMENNDIRREDWRSIAKKQHAWMTPTGFVGFEDQYWQTVLHLGAADQTIRLKTLADGRLQAETSAAAVSVPAGQTVTVSTNIFAGPKTQSALGTASAAIPGIEQTIDYGWFWFLTRPFLWSINAIHGFVGNYGVAIILFTIFLRILMWPLTRKSFTSMAAMQKMQPQMQRIQKEYAHDKMRMQQEMMKMYKENKTSPMGGCLPMILQIPIFFALYKVLLISVPMRHANFLWITDLSVMDPYFILPIIMGATMWYQMHLQNAASKAQAADPNNPMAQMQKFMKWMPIIFTVMFAFMPAGLVLYWTVSNVFGIGQMWWIKRSSK